MPSPGDELRAALKQVEDRMEPVLLDQLKAMIDRDWPMPPGAPTTPPDDEALEENPDGVS